MANWERFLHAEDDLDPLVRMAIVHYQFEAIHPFTDGNGRTGRILNSLYLVASGLLPVPILYLSRYIIANRPAYYDLLLDVTRSGAWEAWISYMLDAVEETAGYARIANVVEAGLVGRQAASRYLTALVSIGVLEDERVGRERLFINRRLLDLLNADDDS